MKIETLALSPCARNPKIHVVYQSRAADHAHPDALSFIHWDLFLDNAVCVRMPLVLMLKDRYPVEYDMERNSASRGC